MRTICAGKGNLNTLCQAISGLCSLGLSGFVDPLLTAVTPNSPDWPARKAAILNEAGKLATGHVDWQTQSALFRGNLEALTPGNPAISSLAEFWRAHQSEYDLYQANDGNFQIVDRKAPVILAGVLGGLIDHRALTRLWTYQPGPLQIPNPVVFDGSGHGWLLKRALETTHRTYLNYSCAIYVVEIDPAAICMLLHLHDLRAWAQRLRLFVGPAAREQFVAGLEANDSWMLPSATINQPLRPRPSLNLAAAVNAVAAARGKRRQEVQARIASYYDQFTIADWAARYEAAQAGGTPLKVMGITSRFTTVLQYSMDELGQAVRAGGHEFILSKEPDDQTATRGDLELIEQHKPDLLILLSRMRYEYGELPQNMPFLCWDQDSLPCMRTPEARKSLDAFTYVAGAGAMAGYQQHNWPRRNCIIALQAASMHRYSNTPVSDELLQKHRCTFSYTSNSSGTPEAFIAQLRGRYAADALTASLFDQAAAEVVRRASTGFLWDQIPLREMLHVLAVALGVNLSHDVREEMLLDLRKVSDRAFRQVALGWVVEYCRQRNATLRFYGTGWESHPVFAPYAAGFLAPGEEMRAVYQASEINLQLLEWGFQHSRGLDGLASGGFFLFRACPELREHDRADELITYMSWRALSTGCVTFGQLEASRDPMIAAGWEIAKKRIPIGKPDEVCQMLDRWRPVEMDNEYVPVEEITFHSQAEFDAMADDFLANPDRRRAVAAKMRQAVAERFSYDARWRKFLAGIASGLRESAAEAAAKPARQAA